MNENRQTKRGLCLMMLHNTFTCHCFSCDVKPDRVSAREQYLHLLKVSSCKEYRIAFGNSPKFWSGMYACWSWHYCYCYCFLCFLFRALPLSLPSLLFPFCPHDRLMSKGPVIVPRMAFLQLHQQLLLFQVVDHQEDLFIPKKVAIFTLKDTCKKTAMFRR